MSAIFAPRAIITFEKSSRTRVESLLPHGMPIPMYLRPPVLTSSKAIRFYLASALVDCGSTGREQSRRKNWIHS